MKRLAILIMPLALLMVSSALNAQWREMVVKLRKAQEQAPFLYELSLYHFAPEKFYTDFSNDTSSTDTWWSLYFEMYESAYDQGILTNDSVLYDQSLEWVRKDTIPIGLFDFDYNTFIPDALDEANNGIYFTWDDDTIMDVVDGPDPYEVNVSHSPPDHLFEIFAMSPLRDYNYFRDVTFRIDPDFIFYESQFSTNIESGDVVRIDFGDGNGFQSIDPTNVQTFDVIYEDSGQYLIRAQVTRDGVPVKQSISKIWIMSDEIRTFPDATIDDIPGLEVGIYYGCDHGTQLVKPVIFLSGIDINEDVHIPHLYSHAIHNTRLDMLKNHQYDFIIVDWKDSKQDLRFHANSVVTLIERLKCLVGYSGFTEDTIHQFVVIGSSMGALIGRFALTRMETEAYQSGLVQGVNTCMPPIQGHNTRLFVSLDGPHEGAFIPVGAQHFVADFYGFPITRAVFVLYKIIHDARNYKDGVLDRPAVEQMLLYHYSMHGLDDAYAEHPMKTEFFNQLDSLNLATGGYPERCKTVATTNGLFDGLHQVGFFEPDAGQDRILQPHDLYMDMDFDISVRFLRLFEYNYFSVDDFRIFANPDGDGPLIDGSVTLRRLNIRGCLTSILTFNGPSGCSTPISLGFGTDGAGMIPIDVMPGGTEAAMSGFGALNWQDRNINAFIFRLQVQTDPNTGSLLFMAQAGLINPLRVTLSVTSDIADFNFMPMASALDYAPIIQGALPWDHDIFNDTVANNMARTPFDVIVGTPSDNGYPDRGVPRRDNYWHSNIRSDRLPGTNTEGFTWLTREIGEEEMYLDNLEINREAWFEAENLLIAGSHENPHYAYPSGFPTTTNTIGPGGFFSRIGNFIVEPDTGNVSFRAGQEIRLMPGFEARQGSRFHAFIEPWPVCNTIYPQLVRNPFSIEVDALQKEDAVEISALDIGKEGSFSVYPNPSRGIIYVAMPEDATGTITLCNLAGRAVMQKEMDGSNHYELNIAHHRLPQGLYLVSIKTGERIFYSKIILNAN